MLSPRLVLVLLALSPFISVGALKYVRYTWKQVPGECDPIAKFSFAVEYCTDGMPILGARSFCTCNHTTNEVMMITWSAEVNATGNGPANYTETVTERFFLGACLPRNGDRVIYVADTKDVCGPTIEEVIAHGKPFDVSSYAAYRLQSSSQSSFAPVLLASFPLVFSMFIYSSS